MQMANVYVFCYSRVVKYKCLKPPLLLSGDEGNYIVEESARTVTGKTIIRLAAHTSVAMLPSVRAAKNLQIV